jgi:hypothetical protein
VSVNVAERQQNRSAAARERNGRIKRTKPQEVDFHISPKLDKNDGPPSRTLIKGRAEGNFSELGA